jgi:hypothetical protein
MPIAVDGGDTSADAALQVPPGVLSDLSCAEARSRPANAGCSFFAVQMSAKSFWDGACFAMAVVNPTTKPAKLKLEREEMTFSLSKVAGVPKGSGRELSYEMFDESAACLRAASSSCSWPTTERPRPSSPWPRTPSARCRRRSRRTPTSASTRRKSRFAAVGRAFHLTSDQPVVAYQFYPYGGASRATAATRSTFALAVRPSASTESRAGFRPPHRLELRFHGSVLAVLSTILVFQ